MTLDPNDESRAIVPQWRAFEHARRTGELDPASILDAVQGPSEALQKLHHEWTASGAMTFASELVAGSLVEGVPEYGRSAATVLASAAASTSRVVDVIVSEVLGTRSRLPKRRGPPQEEVHRLRHEVADRLRDPFAWVDLARAYEGSGSNQKADQAMSIALALAPNNRYILRSASRLFQHQGEIEKAHRLVARAPQIRSDPWLLATEMALAGLMGRSSRHMRLALQLSGDSGQSPWQISELRSALGSAELTTGSVKKARKLFRGSLEDPTDNSLAQAHWAARRHDPGLRSQIGDITASAEAVAWQEYRDEHWLQALAAAEQWHAAEPFLAQPLILGTHLAASCLLDYEKAEELAMLGLRANPESFTLSNNYIYAAAHVGKIIEAEKQLYKLDLVALTDRERIVHTATKGLVAFRKGTTEEGRLLYREAIGLASSHNDPAILASALLNFAVEESRLEARPDSLQLAEEALAKVAKGRFPTLLPLANVLSASIRRAAD